MHEWLTHLRPVGSNWDTWAKIRLDNIADFHPAVPQTLFMFSELYEAYVI